MNRFLEKIKLKYIVLYIICIVSAYIYFKNINKILINFLTYSKSYFYLKKK
jgi:hypothetical protein